MKKLNVGVIGSGYWGPNLIRNFVSLPESSLAAVADLRQDRLAHVKSLYPTVHVTDDYWELFSMNLDAVVVATPPTTHFSIARDCLQHGLHVLVEKPLALNSRDAEELIEIADRKNLTLMVGHTFEYNPAVRELRRIISSGELGKIHYLDAVRVNLGLFQPDLNVLWDLAPHDISILNYILGKEPLKVSAQGAECVVPGKHDIAYLNLEFEDNVLAHVRVSWLDPSKVRRITVVGSKKMVVYDDVEPVEKLKIYDKGVETPSYADTYHEFQFSYRHGDVVSPAIRMAEPLKEECQHFLQSILEEKAPQSDGRVGLKVVRVLEAAERSLRRGGIPEFLTWYETAPGSDGRQPDAWQLGEEQVESFATAEA
ncbi:MAG: Gfo/Idh/MocA family oxidoreductase [Anaerolineae bacterium]|jgi:predicted dehydrogenase|nr:Gfo/Idh/MocA family oxidoreductase [Anaerolineae bacterium]MDX9829353.1 Gfo/Idh/MocA family oxidoreductase [Anaerolineae bacterium]